MKISDIDKVILPDVKVRVYEYVRGERVFYYTGHPRAIPPIDTDDPIEAWRCLFDVEVKAIDTRADLYQAELWILGGKRDC